MKTISVIRKRLFMLLYIRNTGLVWRVHAMSPRITDNIIMVTVFFVIQFERDIAKSPPRPFKYLTLVKLKKCKRMNE